MSRIPKKLLDDILEDPFYKTCARAGLHGHVCEGRVTFEHALIYGGKQVQKKFAILPLCEGAHSVGRCQDAGDLNKEVNVWICLNRASIYELVSISKAIDYTRMKDMLNKKYGMYLDTTFYSESAASFALRTQQNKKHV